jgi:hypothetical protein
VLLLLTNKLAMWRAEKVCERTSTLPHAARVHARRLLRTDDNKENDECGMMNDE